KREQACVAVDLVSGAAVEDVERGVGREGGEVAAGAHAIGGGAGVGFRCEGLPVVGGARDEYAAGGFAGALVGGGVPDRVKHAAGGGGDGSAAVQARAVLHEVA